MKTSLVLLILNGTTKMNLAVFAFLYWREFAKNYTKHADTHVACEVRKFRAVQNYIFILVF